MKQSARVQIGLIENLSQFLLLVLVNAFVGGLLGLERTIVPLLASERFNINAYQGILSFILVFGIAKAVTNYLSGRLANRFGRKRLLVAGWLLVLPVPWLLTWTHSWTWVMVANVLLGAMQGLTWSSTVVMKMDLVGDKRRGLAMGINEAAGYLAVGSMAWATGIWAESSGLEQALTIIYPVSIGIVGLGLGLSLFFIKETNVFVSIESVTSTIKRLSHPFMETSFRNPPLRAVTWAGLINNLNDGMIWGLLPIYLHQIGMSYAQIAWIVATYPAVWGLSQMLTGALSDRVCHKTLLWLGMLMQAIAILGFLSSSQYTWLMVSSIGLGLGTALVYPTFLSFITAQTHPTDRAVTLGTFRFWRDIGYAVGALLTGIIADAWNIQISIWVVAGITAFAAWLIWHSLSCLSSQP